MMMSEAVGLSLTRRRLAWNCIERAIEIALLQRSFWRVLGEFLASFWIVFGAFLAILLGELLRFLTSSCQVVGELLAIF